MTRTMPQAPGDHRRVVDETIGAVRPCEEHWAVAAARHQERLTMPRGSLGRLLELGQRLAAIQQRVPPRFDRAAIVVMAGDHGVAEEGVSAYPPEVTGQMVANFLAGGAAINVLAARVAAELRVVDMGVRSLPPDAAADPALVRHPIGPGTRNFLREPAMSPQEALEALAAGIAVARALPAGVHAVGLGDMGIGNTTSASALAAALTGTPVAHVVGRGTGIDDERLRHKTGIVQRALELHAPDRADPLGAAAALGGFEIVGLAGVALGAASSGMAVVLDGFISSVSGLIALRLAPALGAYCFAAHRSPEPGHRVVLDALGLVPLFDLEMRLGEGTGAALALHLVGCAADLMQRMRTFDAAGVSDPLGERAG